MNLSSTYLNQITDPLTSTVSSPKLDLIQQTWNHIAQRYLDRIASNRILAGRVRAIRLLAVHDAIQSVIDPGNGHIYKDISEGSSIEAAYAAAVKASHDVLAQVFTDSSDREDLADLLEESLALIGKEDEKAAGLFTGAESASSYIRSFIPLLINFRVPKRQPIRVAHKLAVASGGGGFW
jgi:hypothetical protein